MTLERRRYISQQVQQSHKRKIAVANSKGRSKTGNAHAFCPTFQQGSDTVIVERPLFAALGEGEVEGEGIPPVVAAVPNAQLFGLGDAAQALS